MKQEWLMPGAVVPVDMETTAALVAELKRLNTEQEPVAWYVRFDNGRVDLLAAPISSARRAMWESAGKRFTVTPLYTAPRQWQGLTDDEIALICGECAASHADDIRYARAIEAKLKGKNA